MMQLLMREIKSLSFLVILFILPFCSAGQQSKQAKNRSTKDSTQIVAIIDSWQKAWNSHDMHAFANLFHEDGIWILWNGKVWKGRDTIEKGHAEVHKTVFRNSTQKKQIEEIAFVGPEAAVVRLYSTLTGDERYPDKVVESRNLLVITKRKNVWKIGWGQNTRFPEFTNK
jgi:uncharacterized protein (TIGR02246 family)